MKGIETTGWSGDRLSSMARSDHCPAMKGIETSTPDTTVWKSMTRSDHCPAMKGIETNICGWGNHYGPFEATTAPQ